MVHITNRKDEIPQVCMRVRWRPATPTWATRRGACARRPRPTSAARCATRSATCCCPACSPRGWGSWPRASATTSSPTCSRRCAWCSRESVRYIICIYSSENLIKRILNTHIEEDVWYLPLEVSIAEPPLTEEDTLDVSVYNPRSWTKDSVPGEHLCPYYSHTLTNSGYTKDVFFSLNFVTVVLVFFTLVKINRVENLKSVLFWIFIPKS